MTEREVDYIAVFRDLPVPVLLLTPELIMADLNLAYEGVAGRTKEDLVGRSVFDAFPDNPSEPGSGAANLSESLHRVLATGERDVMPLQRYDVEVSGSGVFEERYWCPVNAPVRGGDGEVVMIIHAVEEVSDLIRKYAEAGAANA